MPIWTIARLTLVEVTRRRLLLAVFILTALIIALTGWGFSHIATMPCGNHPCSRTEILSVSSGLVILLVYMFSFVVAAGAAFLAAPAVSADVDSGVVLAVLPRPIRRRDFVLGKWLGLVIVLVLYTVIAAGLEFLVINLTTGYLPPQPGRSIAYLAVEGVVLLTLALLGSTRLPPMTVGIIALVLYGIVWIGGIVGSIGQALANTTMVHVGTVSSLLLPTDGMWRGALFNLEPVAMRALTAESGAVGNTPFTVSAPPTTAYLVWVAAWLVVVLGAAVASFDRRDL